MELERAQREIIAVGNDKAYVTDLFGNYINVVDLASNSITSDTIRVGNNPDKMFNHGDHVFVSNNGFGADSTIFKIDIATHAIVDTIVVHRGPAGMVEGAQNSIWVVSRGYSGDYDSDYNLILNLITRRANKFQHRNWRSDKYSGIKFCW